ncbi:hypothetical protein PGTUg99_000114 [Puccinia graminis f. sp. tritici]|uniref:Uncharacterized protein n=1 Tax=Puccinia graminis f. sp. tritici TaxID=56615 RepID=A0A5B0RRM4_PUCGR|nr:hypothetical protein PGTUg99_000114 [Puccinia graminis f. sp. tritici]
MAKKKSSLSQALQQAQTTAATSHQASLKETNPNKKNNQKQSASKSQKNKHTIPSTQSSPTRAQKHLKNRPEKRLPKPKTKPLPLVITKAKTRPSKLHQPIGIPSLPSELI